MNKLHRKLHRSFFSLAIIILMLFISTIVQAQDYKLGLGRAWLRYDYDSNKIRVGSVSLPYPKLARELNSQLFDFNSQHFSWSPSTGLNLLNTVSHDSLWLSIDTGDGEIYPMSVRSYTLKKSNWYNTYNGFELIYKYRSYVGASLVAEDSAWAINDAGVPYDYIGSVVLTTEWQTIRSFEFPKQGLYMVTIEYEYEFEWETPTYDFYDSITVTFSDRSVTSFNNTTKFSGKSTVKSGFQGKAILTKLVNYLPGTAWTFKALCSTSGGTMQRLIKSYKISYILIR